MPITDNLVLRIKPQAGDSNVHDEISSNVFSGSATATLIDIGAEKAWSLSGGTLSANLASTHTVGDGGTVTGVTIAKRVRVTNWGSTDFVTMAIVNNSGGGLGPKIMRAGTQLRGRFNSTGLTVATSGITPLNTVVTVVYRVSNRSGMAATHEGALWWNVGSRANNDPQAVTTANIGPDPVLNTCDFDASNVAYDLLDFVYWNRELSDAEAAAVADNLRGQLDAGSPPAGTVTISGVTPGVTTAQVTYSYNNTDQTGFEYRLNGGAAASIGASPATITGLTASTNYDVEVRAINGNGAGAWSAVSNFTTNAAGDTTPPVLSSPTGTQTGSTTASGTVTTDEGNGTLYYLASTNSTETGTTIKAGSSQVVSGTGVQNVTVSGLTPSTTYHIHYIHTDAAANDSNVVSSAGFTTDAAGNGTVTVTEPLKNNTGTVLANESGVRVAVLRASDLVSVHEQTGLTTNASGVLSAITNAAISVGVQYHVAIKTAGGGIGVTGPITAT